MATEHVSAIMNVFGEYPEKGENPEELKGFRKKLNQNYLFSSLIDAEDFILKLSLFDKNNFAFRVIGLWK